MRTLYRNGRLYTAAVREATALLVEDGVITWIGTEDGAGELAGVRVVDLADAFVTPAFVDAHVHCTATGIALSGLDLSAADTLADALDLVERTTRASRGRPVVGGGWDESRWPERRPPTAAELDRAGYGGAVYLARVDAHSAVVSSALLAGVRELPGYRADGHLTRAAHDAARTAALGALSQAQITMLHRTALQHAAALGIASVHEMAGPAISSERDLLALLALAAAEPLPEVIGYWGELHGIAAAGGLGAIGAAGDLFCDGSLGSHTAALHQPYADRPETAGTLRFETSELAEHIVSCTTAGMQAGFHAIGDAAVDQVLDAVELASQRLGRPAGPGHRIEHAEFVRDPGRLAASGLLASMQPAFDAAWGGGDGMYTARLGPERAAQLNRFADLAAAGVPLAFGSDAPVTPLAPWAAVRAAAYPHEPAAAITPQAALIAHTRAGWRAARRNDEGVLATGAPATFAVWSAGDPRGEAPDDEVARGSTDPRAAGHGLPDLRPGRALPSCLATIRNGVAIFDSGPIGG